MPSSRFRRVPLAAAAAAAIVLFADWACRADRSFAPRAPAAPPTRTTTAAGANLDSVRLRYLCANRFRIRNHNDAAVAAQWAVAGTPDTGTVLLPARDSGQRFSETFLDVPDSGTVQLFVGGVRIASAANRGRVCGTKALAVRVDAGVLAGAATRDSVYAEGASVAYAFSARPGYTNLLVMLDDSLVPPTGTVTMDRSHFLWAAADLDVSLPPPGDPWVAELRGLLTAPDPVAEYQRIMDDVGALYDAVGPIEASRRVQLAGLVAYDPVRDSAAIVRVDSALALHEFVLGGSEYGGSGGGGGGGGLIADRLPAGRDVAAAAGCAPLRPLEVPASPEQTRILYVNGIRTMPYEAISTGHALRCALERTGQIASSRIFTRTFYNRTWSRQLPQDLRRDFWCIAAGFRWNFAWSALASAVAFGRCARDALGLAVATQDYVEALRQYVQVADDSPTASQDADSLARYLHGVRTRNGEHVLLVAHSQGNLLTQQAVALLRTRGQYAPARDSLCIGAVSVAAPTSANWPVRSDFLVGVQARGDILPMLTRRNHFTEIPTAYSDSTDALIAEIEREIAAARDRRERQALVHLLSVVRLSRGVRLHSMDDTYLGEPPARDAITDGVTFLHRQCTVGGLALHPASATLRVQSSLPIEVTAVNRNSTTMSLNRAIDWNVPSHLKLARGERRVTALAPGEADLTAGVFDRRTVATIAVPMEALSVTATQALHSAWQPAQSNAPPSIVAPDPGPPPEWDGNPATCTQSKRDVVYDPVARSTFVWDYIQHCWYSAAATAVPPDSIKITSYWWRWYDVSGSLRDAPTNRLATYSPQDMPGDLPITFFGGWGRVEVWGLNADGTPIAKGSACISNCGGTP